MRRRDFALLLFGGLAQWPLAVRGQPIAPMRHVEILVAEAMADDPYYENRLTAVREGLRVLGWIEGQNLKLNIHRAAPKIADIRKHVAEILAVKPDVIVTSGGTYPSLARVRVR